MKISEEHMSKYFLYLFLSTIAANAQTHFLVSGFPSPTTVGIQGSFTVTAKNSSNNTDPAYLGTVHFTSSDGFPILPADYTFVPGDFGVKVFFATLNTIGANVSITVTDIASLTITGSQTGITVTSGLPVELTLFTANVKGNIIELKWNTATEVNNFGFEIEKTNIGDNLSIYRWNKIGFVEGSGTTNAPKYYSFYDNNITVENYFYRLKQIDRDGKYEYSKEVEVSIVNEPKEFALTQNYPNPFNPSTTLRYSIPERSNVKLLVFNTLGQQVAQVVNETKDAGYYEHSFNASQLSSGVYFYRIEATSEQNPSKVFVDTKKMVLMR
jgi:hypothetical protein